MRQEKEYVPYTGTKRITPIIGEKYGCYEIISDICYCYKNKNGVLELNRTYYKVKCTKCNKICYQRRDILNSYVTTQCRSCDTKEKIIKNITNHKINSKGFSTNHRGVGDLTKTFYSYLKRTALKRNLEFNVSIEYLWNLLVSQDFKCAISKLTIELKPEDKTIPLYNSITKNINWDIFSASLDRIDSYHGYIEGNVQWVHRNVNIMKNSFSQDYFITLCNLISHANQQPSLMKSHEKHHKKGSETREVNSDSKNLPHENPPSQ